jgi:dihydroorotase-like cyclic amidohydrolase
LLPTGIDPQVHFGEPGLDIKKTSTAVAHAYSISNKGTITAGYDANLVRVNLNTYQPVLRQDLLTKCG